MSDGVPIRVPWLEEETLFYIWRGRLERAALCLSYCDRDRLLVLLRGERPFEGEPAALHARLVRFIERAERLRV